MRVLFWKEQHVAGKPDTWLFLTPWRLPRVTGYSSTIRLGKGCRRYIRNRLIAVQCALLDAFTANTRLKPVRGYFHLLPRG